jgi:hypothetical protein
VGISTSVNFSIVTTISRPGYTITQSLASVISSLT